MTGCDRLTGVLPLLLLALLLAPGTAGAQDVRLLDEPADSAARVIARVLERPGYLLLNRDTTLADDARIPRDVVIAGATVRLEGQVRGTIVVLDGELFIRPGAVVTGPIAVAGGAVYRSALAEMGPVLEVPPTTAVAVETDSLGYTVLLTPAPSPRRLRPSGMLGVSLPSYDRVDGLTVGWGSRLLLAPSETGAFARAEITYAAERQRLGGSAALEVPLGRGTWALAEVERATFTNDAWIRGTLFNSLAAVTLASDARDYHESDVVTAGVYRRRAQPLIRGERSIEPRLLVRGSRDRSLRAGDPWSLTGDWRENPPISDGTMLSVIGGVAFGWRGASSAFESDAAFEWSPRGWGDFEVAQLVADGRWTMRGLWNHEITLYSRGVFALAGDPLPLQRWSILGGTGTLSTLEPGARRGDNLVFVRSIYAVPIRGIHIPMLGEPTLRATHAAGTAWMTGEPLPRWDQNIGAGLTLGLVTATVWVDPSVSRLDPVIALSLSLSL